MPYTGTDGVLFEKMPSEDGSGTIYKGTIKAFNVQDSSHALNESLLMIVFIHRRGEAIIWLLKDNSIPLYMGEGNKVEIIAKITEEMVEGKEIKR